MKAAPVDDVVFQSAAMACPEKGGGQLRVFTDDSEALRRAVVRDPQKSIALEAVQKPRQSVRLSI